MGNVRDWTEASVSTVQVTRYYAFNGQRVAMREGDVVYYLHGDHLGSTSVASSDSGVLHSRQGYTPYGEVRYVTGELPTEFGFTGQRNDSYIKLIQMGARWYNPVTGRWISADTLVPNPANPQEFNRYNYVLGNPLRYIDPTGHVPAWDPGMGGRLEDHEYKKAYGVYGYPMPDELAEAFEAGYNPFCDPDNFVDFDGGTVGARGGANGLYFQEYYHWAHDTGGWLPLPKDLRSDVFAYWTVVQSGRGVTAGTDWKDIGVLVVDDAAVFAANMAASKLGGANTALAKMQDVDFQRLVGLSGYDCSEIADDLYNAAGGQGRIMRIDPSSASGQVLVPEASGNTAYRYHEVYTDGSYVFDPRLSSDPMRLEDYVSLVRGLNSNAVINYFTR